MAEFTEVHILLLCPLCRGVFTGEGVSLSDPCPKCGATGAWSAYLRAGCIIDDRENSEALKFIINNVDHNIVADVAELLGFKGGGCCKVRHDNSRIEALREYIEGEAHKDEEETL
ncbi:MAG: hypothetical protein KKE73_09640 [Proteobacteria bacterium]|nr:hypothetical protein [Pseudomonadota bacterium]